MSVHSIVNAGLVFLPLFLPFLPLPLSPPLPLSLQVSSSSHSRPYVGTVITPTLDAVRVASPLDTSEYQAAERQSQKVAPGLLLPLTRSRVLPMSIPESTPNTDTDTLLLLLRFDAVGRLAYATAT